MSTYIQYFPEIYQDSEGLNSYLKIFEKILTGINDGIEYIPGETYKGIEDILSGFNTYLDPVETPSEFLSWLASWIAPYPPEDWSETIMREMILKVVPLYKKRGTAEGVKELILLYIGEGHSVTVYEWLTPFQIGKASTVGFDTVLGEAPPGYFKVEVNLSVPDTDGIITNAIIGIIDSVKPAHTYYDCVVTLFIKLQDD